MKQRNLIRRLTAALVSGAMALSLCAPALAAADEPAATLQPGTYPEGSIAVVYKDKENPIVVKENTDDIHPCLQGRRAEQHKDHRGPLHRCEP